MGTQGVDLMSRLSCRIGGIVGKQRQRISAGNASSSWSRRGCSCTYTYDRLLLLCFFIKIDTFGYFLV